MALQLRNQDDAPSSFEIMTQASELAVKLATTEFVPAALRNKPAAVMAAILTGHEIGLPPMASLAHIHVIDGRPTLSAAAMRALILSKGHEIWIEEQTATRARVCGRRRGEDRVTEASWTADDVKRAGLGNKPNHQRYPKQMLVARATGDCARGAFMDVLGGIPYTTEEAEDMQSGAPAPEPPADGTPPPADGATRTTKRKAGRAATEPEASEPPPGPEPEVPPENLIEGQFRSAEEPPPAPEPEATPEKGQPDPDSQPKAGVKAEGEHMSLAQQVAMHCREAGVERQDVMFAVTGKLKGSELTRPQAIEVLEAAKAIARGEKRLVDLGQGWQVLDVEDDPDADPDGPGEDDQW